jgi:hypothetical protein
MIRRVAEGPLQAMSGRMPNVACEGMGPPLQLAPYLEETAKTRGRAAALLALPSPVASFPDQN